MGSGTVVTDTARILTRVMMLSIMDERLDGVVDSKPVNVSNEQVFLGLTSSHTQIGRGMSSMSDPWSGFHCWYINHAVQVGKALRSPVKPKGPIVPVSLGTRGGPDACDRGRTLGYNCSRDNRRSKDRLRQEFVSIEVTLAVLPWVAVPCRLLVLL